MENNLDRVMEEICLDPAVLGCLFADQQGLCIGSKGQASNETSGYITAIANQVAKLEPNSKMPVVTLENENQICMIQKADTITGAIYKKL
ncbi:unnamed protein product [Ceutorhynchus assimilis]|uniref:Late endosomal/lysosomal adaptor and MAPK and MTOR activator 5 n=1 Tax=Ceutorhynchus assimilis TaxID=467358 RepID=A0A9N9N3X7_9CUCU|nr:unnamed protein product [Ceutorhynchus assimilis]